MNETPPPNDPFHPEPPDESFRYDEPIPEQYRWRPGGAPGGLPWERRRELGFWRALWETIKGVLLDPFHAFSSMRTDGSQMDAIFFYVLVGWIGGLVSLLWQIPFQMLQVAPAMTQGGQDAAEGALVGAFGVAYGIGSTIVCLPVGILIGALILSALWHLTLIVWPGPRRKFVSTFKVCCYAGGATSALNVIPCFGGCVAGIWMLVSAAIGLTVVHRTDGVRATVAVLAPMILCGCCAAVVASTIMIAALSESGPLHDMLRNLVVFAWAG